METCEELKYYLFAVMVIGVVIGIVVATTLSYFMDFRNFYNKDMSELRMSLQRNEAAAVSLSKQIQEQAAGPKTYVRPHKNRVVSISESERARREDKKTKD